MRRKRRIGWLLAAALALTLLGLLLGHIAEYAWLVCPKEKWDEHWDAQYSKALQSAQAWLSQNGEAVERAMQQARPQKGHLELLDGQTRQQLWSGHLLELALDNGKALRCYPYAERAAQGATDPLSRWRLSFTLLQKSGGAVGYFLDCRLHYYFTPRSGEPQRFSSADAGEYARSQWLDEHWRFLFRFDR